MNLDCPRKKKYNLHFEEHEIKYSRMRDGSLQANLRIVSQEIISKIKCFEF